MVEMRDITRRLVEPLKRRVLSMISRGVVKLINDAAGRQELQLVALDAQTLDRIERFQEYGFTSHPHPDAEAVVLSLAGARDHSIVIAVEDRRYRLQGLAAGEVALYDDLDQKVHLKRNGIVTYSPLNILHQTDGIFRVDAEGIELHGRTYLQTEVHGKGQRETWAGGTAYNIDSYTTGATGGTTEHGLDQPDLPSDHPEGP